MRIAVDIDGVKADFCGSFLPFVNKRYGTNFTKADITRYSFDWQKNLECLQKMVVTET